MYKHRSFHEIPSRSSHWHRLLTALHPAAAAALQELQEQLKDSEATAASLQDELAGMQQQADSLVQQLAEEQVAHKQALARASAAEQQMQEMLAQQDEDGSALQASLGLLKQQVVMLRQGEAAAKEEAARLQVQLGEASAKVRAGGSGAGGVCVCVCYGCKCWSQGWQLAACCFLTLLYPALHAMTDIQICSL
jgi:chromosome segregation ATPase